MVSKTIEWVVLEALAELKSEKYARQDLVPVWELRRSIAEVYGSETASHEFFDRLLKDMRWRKVVRLVAIGDRSDATLEQMDESIPGEEEDLFYIQAGE